MLLNTAVTPNEQSIRTGEHDPQSIAKSAERRPQGDFRRDYRGAMELLNRADGQSPVNDVRKGEHHLESGFEHVANWAERELPFLTILQELRKGQHDVENGVKGAARSITSDLPGLDVRRDVRRGERDLRSGLRRLDPENMVRDVQRSEHEVHADFKDAERALEQMMPAIHVGRDLQRSERDWVQEGERELNHGLKGAERMVERVLLDLHFGRDVQKGGHELRIGENDLVQEFQEGQDVLSFGLKGAESIVEGLLPDVHLCRNMREGEHELERDLQGLGGKHLEQDVVQGASDLKAGFRVAEKVVDQFLPDLHISGDMRAGEHDLVEGMQKGANIAEKKVGKFERTGMGAELDTAGRSVEHSMARLGESTMSNVHRDQRSVGKETGAVGQGAEHEASPMGRFMQDGRRKGEHTVNGGFRATERDQSTTQDHGRVEGRTPNKTSNTTQSVHGISIPWLSVHQ